MANAKQKNPDDDLVPIVNRRRGIAALSFVESAKNQDEAFMRRLRPQVIDLPPGFNVIDPVEFDACGGDKAIESMPDLEVRMPTMSSEFEAIEIAKRSGNRKALKWWLARETRDKVKAAIENRLAGKKAA